MWCWRRFLRVPWTARRSNQSILKEISPGISLEGMMLKLKLQYFGHLMWSSWLIGKDSDAGRDWGQEEKGPTEDEMAGWHYWLNGREFRWTPGVGDGRGGLACCDSWGHKESEMTEQVNWTNCLLETNNKNNKWVIMETKCRIRVKIIVNNAEKWMSAVKIRKYEKFLSWRIEGNRKGNLGINTQRYNGKKKNFLH